MKSVTAFEDSEGNLHHTQEKALAKNLVYLVEEISQGETQLDELTASYMVQHYGHFRRLFQQVHEIQYPQPIPEPESK